MTERKNENMALTPFFILYAFPKRTLIIIYHFHYLFRHNDKKSSHMGAFRSGMKKLSFLAVQPLTLPKVTPLMM
ncbi:MAG: hypothetical protein WAP91_01625, partial [Bacilli bacterium]